MLKITFDTEAYKTKAIDGHYPSRQAILDACEKADFSYQKYDEFLALTGAENGSIVTTAYNPDLLARRGNMLWDQLLILTGEKPQPENPVRAPAILTAAIKDAVEEKPDGKIEMLMFSTSRENAHFDLRDTFPKLQTTVAAATDEYADRCNDLIMTEVPGMQHELTFTTDWQNKRFDIINVNTAIHYVDEADLPAFVEQLADTGAERIVFSNLLQNKDEGGAAYWQTQRYSGGIIPLRIPGRGELSDIMQRAGYELVDEVTAPFSFTVNNKSILEANKKTDNYTFIRRLDPL